MKKIRPFLNRRRPFAGGALAVVLVVGLLGARVLVHGSSAATYTHNPFGYADDCNIVNNQTVIYGWIHDVDAPAGALPSVSVKVGTSTTTVASNQVGYRDAPINAYINNNYPGMPTSSVYGWKLSLSGLYKGTSYVVTPTGINVGTGSNALLTVHTGTTYVDGDTSRTPFTSSHALPDICLLTKPTPPPTPSPTPTPAPKPSPSPSPTPVKTTPKTTLTPTPSPVSPPAVTTSSATDATVTAGTTTANVAVSVDKAQSFHIKYGTDPVNLSQTTTDQPTNGVDTEFLLVGLQPKTTYTYQIVRTISGQAVASPTASFKTTGFNLVLHFVSNANKPVSGVQGLLGTTRADSDKDGDLTFKNLAVGKYTLVFNYHGHNYNQALDTAKAGATTGAQTASVEQTVNLDKLVLAAAKSGKHSVWPLLLLILVLILLLFGAIIWFMRRRSNASSGYPSLPDYAHAPGADIIDQQTNHHFAHKKPGAPEPMPEHMGQSLPDMVIESMRAEAARRKAEQPPDKPE